MIVTMKFAPGTYTEVKQQDIGAGETETSFNIRGNSNGAALYLADTREGGRYYIVAVQEGRLALVPIAR